LPVVKHALKIVAADRISRVGGNEINVKLAIATGEHHRISKRVAAVISLCASVDAERYYTEQNKVCLPRHCSFLRKWCHVAPAPSTTHDKELRVVKETESNTPGNVSAILLFALLQESALFRSYM
jgi:hypothetical protein